MRPAWRLCISTLSVRRSRTGLLIATVALSAALIAAVACAMASVHDGMRDRVEATVGAADLRLTRIGQDLFGIDVVEKIRAWPETKLVVPRLGGAIALKRLGGQRPVEVEESSVSSANVGDSSEVIISTIGSGLSVPTQWDLYKPVLEHGRLLERDDEIMLDTSAASELGAAVGDEVEVQSFGPRVVLKIVGIVLPPPLGTLSKPESYVTLATMQGINQTPGKIREVDILVNDSRKAEIIAEERSGAFEKGFVLRAGSKILSGLNKNLEGSQMGMRIASILAFLAAAFIIMTGLTTGVTERQRELAIVRCIGGTKWQVAQSQLMMGCVIGVIGAMIGLPLGMLGSYVLVSAFPDKLPSGFAVNWGGLVVTVLGSVGAGLIGAAWPAVKAARTSPLEAMVVRANKPRISRLLLCLVCGAILAGVHFTILNLGNGRIGGSGLSVDQIFWLDIIIGIPSLVSGYFLMAVPATLTLSKLASPAISLFFRLPRGLLERTIAATPYRIGFTAAAMMMGLALLVGIWTNGQAIVRDWLGSLEFPDAFVAGISLSERTKERIDKLPFVTGTAAVSIQTFKTDAFGLKVFDHAETTFIGFDPEPFFRMTRLTWIEGDQATALKKLQAGGAVIVAREFKVARGLGVGDRLRLVHENKQHEFEIVGVVNSPGLDIASKFFSIGEDYLNQAVNGVFGSREDLKKIFGNTGIQLIQVGIRPDYDDKRAMKEIRRLAGFEVISAGSGREIKNEIGKFLHGSLFVMSLVAIGAMLVACFGVANLIVAGIQARQFEFGVMRAIGTPPGILTRLVVGEALIVALGACVMGTLLGLQISWGGQRMYELILGIVLHLRLPLGPTAAGWGVVTLITLGAALPAVISLSRRKPRELLGAVRG